MFQRIKAVIEAKQKATRPTPPPIPDDAFEDDEDY